MWAIAVVTLLAVPLLNKLTSNTHAPVKPSEQEGGLKKAYHHEESYAFISDKKQDKNMGFEFDFGFDYKWNPNVTISGYYAYWKLGDYYAYSNDTEELSLANVHGGGLRATLEF